MLLAALLTSALCVCGEALRVAIVGAGPVGLFLAARLLELGPAAPLTDIDVFEAGEDPRLAPSDRSFAIGISPRVFAAMAAVPGLKEHVEGRAAENISELVRLDGWTSRKSSPARMRVTTQVILCLVTLYVASSRQPLFASALLDWIENAARVRPSPRCRVLFGSRCIHVDPHAGRVVVEERNGLRASSYDLVVGCDGARSVVRQTVLQQTDVRSESYPVPRLWRSVAIDAGGAFKGRMAVWSLDGCRGGCWHMPTGKVPAPPFSLINGQSDLFQVHAVFFWRPDDEEDSRGPPPLRSRESTLRFLEHVLGSEVGSVPDMDLAVQALSEPRDALVRVCSVSQYHHREGKVAITGDAAHTMSSALGQVD